MQYPNTIQYKQAVQDQESFATLNNDLHPVMDGYEPVLASGNFAVVFKMLQNGKKHALKCFTKESAGRAERQKMIVEYIKQNPSEHFVEYHYLENELWIAEGEGMEVPVTWMEWVEAPTLGEKIKDYCESKDTDGLQLLVESFREFALWILQQPFAHGDLKHDNLLVKDDGTLVMVDYDGMFIPAFDGLLANELGSKGYQHPKRTANYFNDDLDDFSIVVIYFSLLALVEDPELYNQYNNGQNIIFDSIDFINPERSPLITNLKSSISLEFKVGDFAQICKNRCQSLMNIKELIDTPISRKEYQIELEETLETIISHFKQLSHNNQLGKSQFRLTEEILDSQIIITRQLFDNLQKKLPLKSFSEERVLTEEWWYSLSEEWKDLLLFNKDFNQVTKEDFICIFNSKEENFYHKFGFGYNVPTRYSVDEVLKQLSRLKSFYIFKCQIRDLSPLSKLTNLEHLDLYGTYDNLHPLSKLINLTTLDLKSNSSRLEPIIKLYKLTQLSIGSNSQDLNAVGKLINLSTLNLYDNYSDLSPLSKLQNLKTLYLTGNESDLSPIGELGNLTSLNLTSVMSHLI